MLHTWTQLPEKQQCTTGGLVLQTLPSDTCRKAKEI